jgi:hypothetical protein
MYCILEIISVKLEIITAKITVLYLRTFWAGKSYMVCFTQIAQIILHDVFQLRNLLEKIKMKKGKEHKTGERLMCIYNLSIKKRIARN